MYGWLLAEELVRANPFGRMRLSVPETLQPTPSDAEVAAMLERARADRRAHALLSILVATGARRDEVAALTYADLDLRSG
jgi:site-specific recombinase XerD